MSIACGDSLAPRSNHHFSSASKFPPSACELASSSRSTKFAGPISLRRRRDSASEVSLRELEKEVDAAASDQSVMEPCGVRDVREEFRHRHDAKGSRLFPA